MQKLPRLVFSRFCAAFMLVYLCAVTECAEVTGTTLACATGSSRSEQLLMVAGMVSDADHRPLADVEINVVGLGIRSQSDPLAGTRLTTVLGKTKANNRGHFCLEVRREAAQDLELVAYRPGYGLWWAFLDVKKDNRELTLHMRRPAVISGRVIDDTGRAVPRTVIKLCSIRSTAANADQSFLFLTPPEQLSSWPQPIIARDDGTFSLEGIGARSEVVLEIDDERIARQRWIFAIDGQVATLVVNGSPCRKVTGQIVAEDTGAPACATIVLTARDCDDRPYGTVAVQSDAKGRFAVRPFAQVWLDIHVVPQANTDYKAIDRRIPWPNGTITQNMALSLHKSDRKPAVRNESLYSSTSTIEASCPAVDVEHVTPRNRLNKRLTGTIVAAANLSATINGKDVRLAGAIAIEPNSGRWRTLAVDGLSPRVSPSAKCIAYARIDRSQLEVLSLGAMSPSNVIARGLCGSVPRGIWGADEQSLFTSVNIPAQRDYNGEVYWGEDNEVWKVDKHGMKLQKVPIPPLYDLYDVSRDGKWAAMHWDTHSVSTGAQLYVARIDEWTPKCIARKAWQYYWYPRFHPSNRAVCAKHLDASTGDVSIRVISVDGTNERSIAIPGYVPESACWCPTGNFIAIPTYQASSLTNSRKVAPLFVVDEAGSQIREVALENVEQLSISDVEWTSADLFAK